MARVLYDDDGNVWPPNGDWEKYIEELEECGRQCWLKEIAERDRYIEELKKMKTQPQEIKKSPKLYAITISPKEDVTWKDLLERFIAWKAPLSKYGVLEQRSDSEEDRGRGPHLHALVQLKQTHLGNARALVHRYWAEYCPAKKAVHVSRANDPDSLKDLYYEGDKSTHKKMLMAEQDKIWRKENNIPHPIDATPQEDLSQTETLSQSST